MIASAGARWIMAGVTVALLSYLLPGEARTYAGYSIIPLSFGFATIGLWWVRTGLPPRQHLRSLEGVLQLLVVVFLLWVCAAGLFAPYLVGSGQWMMAEGTAGGYLIIGTLAGIFAILAAFLGHGPSAPVSQRIRCSFWTITALIHWQVLDKLEYLVDVSDQQFLPSAVLPLPAVALALLTGPWAGEGWSRKPRAAVADEAAPEA